MDPEETAHLYLSLTHSIFIAVLIANFLINTGRIDKALELCKECLYVLNNKVQEKAKQSICLQIPYIGIYSAMVRVYSLVNDTASKIECCKKLAVVLRGCGLGSMESRTSFEIATLYESQSKYKEAKEFYEKALNITRKVGDRKGEAKAHNCLGAACHSLGESVKAIEHFKKALIIRKEIGDRKGEALDYGNLGSMFTKLGEYSKAKTYHEKALLIRIETGDREGEALSHEKLGDLFSTLREYGKAEECFKKAINISKETDNMENEASSYVSLAIMFNSIGKCFMAEECVKSALPVKKQIGDRKGEANCYLILGSVTQSHVMSEQYYGKALAIYKEIGDREGEAICSGNIGTVYKSLGQYGKAQEYFEKAISIGKEIGSRKLEGSNYISLGAVFLCLCEYINSEECLKKALVVMKEIGDREGEADAYLNLGTLFSLVGENIKAKDYVQKALAIYNRIVHRKKEALCYGQLGGIFIALAEYVKAVQYLQRAVWVINEFEICDRESEGKFYLNLGCAFSFLREYDKSEDYKEKALAISKETGNRELEVMANLNLGTMFVNIDKYDKAKESLGKALELSKEIRNTKAQFECNVNLAIVAILTKGNIHEACSNVLESVCKCEEMRRFLRSNDQFKISFFDEHAFKPYQMVSAMCCAVGLYNQALYFEEHGRARALADLMSAQYSVEKQMSADPPSFADIENITKIESNCTLLYISYFCQCIFWWILKENKPTLYRKAEVSDFINTEPEMIVDDVFQNETLRKFNILPKEQCEDCSLFTPLNASGHQPGKSQEENSKALRKDSEADTLELEKSLALYYKVFITPVVDLLDEPEIVIVPYRSLYKVPFAALRDENGTFLAEKFRIRVVPSLTTLKLIQKSPADYHSPTGALVVGDPDVGRVLYKGYIVTKEPLPAARKEAEMIGRLVGAEPLLGQQATKRAVLQSISSVSLIHFAAHANAERGEIILASLRSTDEIPSEKDYLLTMMDISEVRLRAKLVVLSCCHSAGGQISIEGAVGIARAFLGSGARSVLVALWAIDDEATQTFMGRFYEHLVLKESASESLHQAMKWMRDNGFSDVSDWAPFMLIGDNVTFDFEQ